jgi:hypothetical protein
MYDSISDFLQELSSEKPALWAPFVLAVVATLSLALYGFWEAALQLFRRLRRRFFPRVRPVRMATCNEEGEGQAR